MKNVEIAKVFQDMADLLELKEENKFKIRAYRQAAQVIEHLPQEMAAMLAQGADFHAIPGIGDAIAKKSTELLQTGNLKALEDLKAEFPENHINYYQKPTQTAKVGLGATPSNGQRHTLQTGGSGNRQGSGDRPRSTAAGER